jgi:hypothetical protein
LIVVDTLAKVRAPGSSKSSPYQNDHDALAGLQKLAEELGIGVLVNHHDRKMAADDVFDTISGTLGLTGAVDTILVLTKKAENVTLHTRGRDLEDESSLAMFFDRESCEWTVLGASSEIHRSSESEKVRAALKTATEGMGVPEIVSVARLSGQNAAWILLHKMTNEGVIERVKRGQYGLPGTRARLAAAAEARRKGKEERSSEKHHQNQADSGNEVFAPGLENEEGATNKKDLKSWELQENGSGLSSFPFFPALNPETAEMSGSPEPAPGESAAPAAGPFADGPAGPANDLAHETQPQPYRVEERTANGCGLIDGEV